MMKRNKELLRITVKPIKGGRKIDVFPASITEELWLDENMLIIFHYVRKLWSLNN